MFKTINQSTPITPNQNLYIYHSKEFKYRLLYVVFTWVCSFLIAFYNMEFILYKLLLPNTAKFTPSSELSSLASPNNVQVFNQTDFIFTEIFEAFFSYLVLSGYLSFIITLPLVYYHLYSFLLPGLTFTESSLIKFLLYLSTFFLAFTHLLTYFIIIPYASTFLLTFQSGSFNGMLSELSSSLIPNLTFLGRIYPWITFVINLFTAVSFLFQLPLFLFTLYLYFKGLSTSYKRHTKDSYTRFTLKQSVLNVKNFSTSFFRKLLFFTLVVLTAIFSPPDIYSQLFLFIPLFFIIEIFIFAVFLHLEYNRKLKT